MKKEYLDSDISLEGLYEVIPELNDHQLEKLVSYAYKLYSDKRFKKNENS